MQTDNSTVPRAMDHGPNKKFKAVLTGGHCQKDQKPKKSRVKGKIGRLAGLLELPFDILLEIFGHLLPLDILHLARTTKQFRRVLMYKSSLLIWKSARANVAGLPDCPPSMAEPKYINLAFDQHCHVCLRPNTRTIFWHLRLRICSNCAKTHLVPVRSSNANYISMVPTHFSKAHHCEVYYLAELQAVQTYLESPSELDEVGVQTYSREREALIAEYAAYAVLCENWADAQALSRSEELEEARQSRKQAIFEKLTELGWGNELVQIPLEDDLKGHRLVKQSTRLTDRIWKNIKAPLVAHMEQMKTKRLERERKVIAINVLRACKISCLPWSDIMPEPADFCAFPEIKAILQLPDDADVDEFTFSEIVPNLPDILARWRGTIHHLLVDRFRQAQKEQLRLTVEFGFQQFTANPSIHASDEEIIRKMRLASTVFKCRNCDEDTFGLDVGLDYPLPVCYKMAIWSDPHNPLFYPKVLGHHCLTIATETQLDYTHAEVPTDPSVKLDTSEYTGERHRKPWICQSLVIDAHAGKMAERIIGACGFDHTQTTVEDMDRLDARLVCLNCVTRSSNMTEVSVYAWRSALKHQAYHHPGGEAAWTRLVGREEESARQAENTCYARTSGEDPEDDSIDPPSDLLVWFCAHCMDLPSQQDPRELHEIKAHIQMIHNVPDPQLNVDYYQDFEAPQGYWTNTWPRASHCIMWGS